jgi:hypothetical protein
MPGWVEWSTAMSNRSIATIATMGIDLGKNSFRVVGLDGRGAIVLRHKWSRGQVAARLTAMPPCSGLSRLGPGNNRRPRRRDGRP